MALGASPPPPYAAGILSENGKVPFPNYLGSPLPATLQMVGLHSEPTSPAQEDTSIENHDWLNERSREELAELLLKADDLIKERESELGLTSAVYQTLHDRNVTLKNKHDALVARIPSTPRGSPPQSHISFPEGLHSTEASDDSARVYIKRRSRRISVSPADISLLSDQNAELRLKLETLQAEAMTNESSSRRALRQLEREIQGLHDELDRTRAMSEQLEKKVEVGAEHMIEEIFKKKREHEAQVLAMRKAARTSAADSQVRDFAPAGFFSKSALSPSSSSELNSEDASYGSEPGFEHPQQHEIVAQLLAKIQELEETNVNIIRQQSETTDKLQAVQRETESISRVYECFSAENGVEWEVVDDDGLKSPHEGTIRFKSFRRSLEAEHDAEHDAEYNAETFLSAMPRKPRKSVLDLFAAANDAGSSNLAVPSREPSTELSPLRFDSISSQSDYSTVSSFAGRPSLQAELGDDVLEGGMDPFLQRSSLYDLSFSISPSPSPSPSPSLTALRSLRGRVSDARASRDTDCSTPITNALQLSVEPPSPSDADGSEAGSVRQRNQDRVRRMSETLSLRSNRWVGGRFSAAPVRAPSPFMESTPRPSTISLPQRLSTALDVVMENFGRPTAHLDVDVDRSASPTPTPSPSSTALADTSVVDENAPKKQKQTLVRLVLEVWLWLQFAIIILVFLWAMAKRGPKSVLVEAERRAVVKRR